MNLVGIDISIDSTAVSILRGDDDLIISNFTVLKKNSKWIKNTMDFIDFEFIYYTYKDIDIYTEKEIMKLREFDHVTDLIYKKIIGNIKKNEKTIVAIEGYNFNSFGNSIIDIVGFSTLLRIKLLDIPDLEKIIIISPKSIKSSIASMVYGFNIDKKGKEIINKSYSGISGGNFDKKDIMVALFDSNIDNRLTTVLNKYKEELLKLKNVSKPLDDIIDSYFIMMLLK